MISRSPIRLTIRPRQLDQKQRVDRLMTAVAQLGERCRELFRWKLEGKSFPEIQR